MTCMQIKLVIKKMQSARRAAGKPLGDKITNRLHTLQIACYTQQLLENNPEDRGLLGDGSRFLLVLL